MNAASIICIIAPGIICIVCFLIAKDPIFEWPQIWKILWIYAMLTFILFYFLTKESFRYPLHEKISAGENQSEDVSQKTGRELVSVWLQGLYSGHHAMRTPLLVMFCSGAGLAVLGMMKPKPKKVAKQDAPQ